MGYKDTDICIKKAFEDEKLFVLMARDHTSPEVVMEWIKLNLRKQPKHKLLEAFTCAMDMIETSAEMNLRKLRTNTTSDK